MKEKRDTLENELKGLINGTIKSSVLK